MSKSRDALLELLSKVSHGSASDHEKLADEFLVKLAIEQTGAIRTALGLLLDDAAREAYERGDSMHSDMLRGLKREMSPQES